MDFTGDYSLNIKIILFEIKGKGTLSGKFSNIHMNRIVIESLFFFYFSYYLITENSFAKVQTIGFTENIDGIEYVRFRLTVKLKIDYAFFHMDNLFNGDSILNDLGNRLVNDNYKLFLVELVPGLETSLARIFSDIINNILQDATYDEMFPE